MAAAVVTVASELLILAGSYPLMKRYFGFFPAPRTLLAAVVAAAGMGGLLWLLRHVPLPALVPLGCSCTGRCCGRSARRAGPCWSVCAGEPAAAGSRGRA